MKYLFLYSGANLLASNKYINKAEVKILILCGKIQPPLGVASLPTFIISIKSNGLFCFFAPLK